MRIKLDNEKLTNCFQKLEKEHLICDAGQFKSFVVPGDQLPEELLFRIGEIRESVFRKSLHGSGNNRDLDGYDQYFYHALVWDSIENEILGGYRFRTNKNWNPNTIHKESYIEKCYPDIYCSLSKNYKFIELGRSFINEQYQKGTFSLFMVWRVILIFLDTYYRDYTQIVGLPWVKLDILSDDSAAFLLQVLSNDFFYQEKPGIKPKVPFQNTYTLSDELIDLSKKQTDMKNVFNIIYDIEKNRNCLPILLKQYTNLMGAKTHGFSTATDFNNLLEVLMSTNLSEVCLKRINRYMRF